MFAARSLLCWIHFNNHPGLLIEVLDASSRKIHKEIVYREGEQGT